MAGELLNDVLWSVDGSWSSSAKPVDNSDAIMNTGVGKHIVGDFTSAKVDLDLLFLPRPFTANLGASGGPCTTVADVLKHFGSGALYLDADASATSAKMDKSYLAPVNPAAIIQLGSTSGDPADWVDIEILRGNVTFNSTTKFDASAIIVVKPVNRGDASLTIAAEAETLPTLNFFEGILNTANVITTLNFYGGDGTHSVAAVGTLNVWAGILRYEHTTISTLTTVHSGATLDFTSNNIKKGSLGTINRYLGGKIIIDSDMHTATIVDLGIEG